MRKWDKSSNQKCFIADFAFLYLVVLLFYRVRPFSLFLLSVFDRSKIEKKSRQNEISFRQKRKEKLFSRHFFGFATNFSLRSSARKRKCSVNKINKRLSIAPIRFEERRKSSFKRKRTFNVSRRFFLPFRRSTREDCWFWLISIKTSKRIRPKTEDERKEPLVVSNVFFFFFFDFSRLDDRTSTRKNFIND